MCLHIDGRIHKINILPVELLAEQFDGFSEPLEVDDLSFPQEPDDVVDIWIITDAQDVVISDASFLL